MPELPACPMCCWEATAADEGYFICTECGWCWEPPRPTVNVYSRFL